MTYEPTIVDQDGNPIEGVFVQVTNLMTGRPSPRTTDGGGYANAAYEASPGDHVDVLVFDPQLRFKGFAKGDVMASEYDGKFRVALAPFA